MRTAAMIFVQFAIFLPLFAAGLFVHLRWFERDLAQRRVTVPQIASGLAVMFTSLFVADIVANAVLDLTWPA